ncbi:hypothetical protein [Allomuricauda sp. SCSIO 64092]|nr:hypothetical protein [Muricauda sp. SCSIO 64092]
MLKFLHFIDIYWIVYVPTYDIYKESAPIRGTEPIKAEATSI